MDFTCEKCGDSYALRDGDEPTRYCDDCAHKIAERVAEFEDWLRYVFENIASEVYAFSECHCDHENGQSPCAYCASEHFVNWFREQPEFEKITTHEMEKDECRHARTRCAGPVSPIICKDCGAEVGEDEE